MQKDDIVGLFMSDGVLYAHKKEENATGVVLDSAKAGTDVSLTNLTGIIDMSVGEVTVINVPTIKDGGSKACDLDLIRNIYENGTSSGEKVDKVAVAGTVARAVTSLLDIPVDIEFAAPQATANAARKGLNVIAICVGDMSKAFIRELENEKIKFNIIDGAK